MPVYPGAHNEHTPHRALGLQAPDPRHEPLGHGTVSVTLIRRRDLLGGLIHEYEAAAA